MGRDKGRGKPLPWEVGWIHGTLSLFSETLTTAAQRAGGIEVHGAGACCYTLLALVPGLAAIHFRSGAGACCYQVVKK